MKTLIYSIGGGSYDDDDENVQVALVIESVMVIKSGSSRGALALCGLETSHGRVDTQCSKYLLWMLLQSSLLLKITKGSEKDSVL